MDEIANVAGVGDFGEGSPCMSVITPKNGGVVALRLDFLLREGSSRGKKRTIVYTTLISTPFTEGKWSNLP